MNRRDPVPLIFASSLGAVVFIGVLCLAAFAGSWLMYVVFGAILRAFGVIS